MRKESLEQEYKKYARRESLFSVFMFLQICYVVIFSFLVKDIHSLYSLVVVVLFYVCWIAVAVMFIVSNILIYKKMLLLQTHLLDISYVNDTTLLDFPKRFLSF